MRIKTPISVIVWVVCLLLTFATKAQTALENTWATNNEVNHLTRGDGKVFMSGDFDWLGPTYSSGAAVFNSTLTHDNSYPTIPFSVECSVSDDAGGWYVVSSFTDSIVHMKADKTAVGLPITTNGTGINTMAKVGNILYIGGTFTMVNSVARNYVAAIDLTDNTLTSWNPTANNYVYSLEPSGSLIYVGGSFSIIGGQTRSKIAAIDVTTGLATSWNANVITGSGYVYTIIAGSSEIYFGGSFANVASSVPSRRNFAVVNTTTGALLTLNPRPDGIINQIVLDGNILYMAGGFAQVAGVAKSEIAALDVTTGLLTSFNVLLGLSSFIDDMGIDGSNLIIGGSFRSVNGVDQPRLAVVDKSTGAVIPTDDKKISGTVRDIIVGGGQVFISGSFNGIAGMANSNGCLAMDEATGEAANWTPAMPPPPTGEYFREIFLHYQQNRVYYLQEISDGTFVLGAVNSSDGAAIATWSVTVSEVSAWAFSNDALYLAGPFTTVNGTPRNGFAAVDLVTGALLPWTIDYTTSAGESIYSMAVFNNVLYVTGNFSFSDNGIDRNDLAAWNATTGVINSWAPQVPVEFQSVEIGAVYNSKVYLIDDGIIRADAVTGIIESGWRPTFLEACEVQSIAIQGSSVYIAGCFSPGLIRADITTGQINGWQPELDDVYDLEGSVNSIVVSGTKLFAGGGFSYETNGPTKRDLAVYELPIPTNNQPPEISATTTAVPIAGTVTIDLVPLITDVDDNQDLSTLQLSSAFSEQGASASINDLYELILDYGGVEFFGTDYVTLSVCDFLAECSQQELTIEVGGDVTVYNALSPNGDGKNEIFLIQHINILPETQSNKVTIYNRWGDAVFEISNYNNDDRVFRGVDDNGKDLPSDTYFYKIEFTSGREIKTGYLSLKR